MISSLTISTVTTEEEMRFLEPEWCDLFVASGSCSPFMTFEWADAWWQHMRNDGRAMRDNLRLRTVRTDSGRLIAVVPMMLTERPSVGPFRVRILNYIGADRNMTEIRGLLALPEFESDVYELLIKEFGKDSWDWIHWMGLRRDTGAEAVIAPALSFTSAEVPDLYLQLPESWDQFYEGLKRNIRESLRKCYNSLRRDNHTFEMRIARTPTEVEGAINRFIELHGARAASNASKVIHADVFGSDNSRHFLHDVCQRFAIKGQICVFEMVIADEVVATRIGFQFGHVLYLYYSGYNPAWGKYSVMTTTVAEAIKYAIERGLKTVNLSTGRDVSKTRWGPSETLYGAGVQMSRTQRAKLAYKLFQFGRRMRSNTTVSRALAVFSR